LSGAYCDVSPNHSILMPMCVHLSDVVQVDEARPSQLTSQMNPGSWDCLDEKPSELFGETDGFLIGRSLSSWAQSENEIHRWIPLPLRRAQGKRHHDPDVRDDSYVRDESSKRATNGHTTRRSCAHQEAAAASGRSLAPLIKSHSMNASSPKKAG
jgi:hypothetical protein